MKTKLTAKVCIGCGKEIEGRGRILCSNCFTLTMSDDPKDRGAKLGDEAFEVEWCSDLPSDGYGGVDMDQAKYNSRVFKSKQWAETFARIVYPKDKFGGVRLTRVILEDPYADTKYAGIRSQFQWEPVGDPWEYSGE